MGSNPIRLVLKSEIWARKMYPVEEITHKQIGHWYKCVEGASRDFAKVLAVDGNGGKSVDENGSAWTWSSQNRDDGHPYLFLSEDEVCQFCDLPRVACHHTLRCAECESVLDSIDYLCAACRPK
jgi:hypothetical protein